MTDMNIWETIANTDWYYFLFYAYIGYLCALSIKPRTVSLRVLHLGFLYVCVLNIALCYFMPPNNRLPYETWMISCPMGILVGRLSANRLAMSVENTQLCLKQPGSVIPLLVYMGCLIIKFYFQLPLEWNIHILQNTNYQVITFATLGFALGYTGTRWWTTKRTAELFQLTIGYK